MGGDPLLVPYTSSQATCEQRPNGAKPCPPLGEVLVPREEGHDLRMEETMSKRARKRRSRKGNKANHGRKPNA